MSHPLRQHGLQWTRGLWDITPIWTVEPSMSLALVLAKPHLPSGEEYGISFFASGAFNKLYLIHPITSGSENETSYIMRVTLPVDPYFKTASEVATLRCVQHHTSIPVPEVIAYDASSENDLGFEWILMTRLTGVSLSELWETPNLSWEERVGVTETVAGWVAQLHHIQASNLGSLFLSDEKHAPLHWLQNEVSSEESAKHFCPLEEAIDFAVGPVVAPAFFYDNRIHLVRNRGPFTNTSSWLTALLNLHIASVNDQKSNPPEDDDYDSEDLADLDLQIEAGETLISLIPKFFLPGPELFVLHHDDISTNNILIDPATHRVTGIVDWESISLQPLWNAQRPPVFLLGPTVDPEQYEAAMGKPRPAIAPLPDPSETNELLSEVRDNLEKMLLRKVYYRTVDLSKEPSDALKRVFVKKVEQVDSPLGGALGWAKRVKAGGSALQVPEWGIGLFVWEDE